MRQYIIHRIFLIVIVVIGVSIMTFSIVCILPGDTAEMIAIAKYGVGEVTGEIIEQIREEEGLSKPVAIRYFRWFMKVCSGDLGRSRITETEVREEIMSRLPATMELAVAGLLVSLIIGIPLGIIAAVRQNTFLDYLCTGTSLLGISIPNFWLGLLLILVFGIHLGILPSYGYGTARHILMPAFSIGLSMAGITTRMTRASMIDVLSHQYIITAKATGFRRQDILRKFALKNALVPVITIAGIQFGYLLEGTVVIETVFSWPGIGSLLVDAIFSRDYTVIQGCVLYIAVLFSIVTLLVDIAYTYLNPSIRFGSHA